jgi:uncharacterized protein (DUF934 family)
LTGLNGFPKRNVYRITKEIARLPLIAVEAPQAKDGRSICRDTAILNQFDRKGSRAFGGL